MVTNLEGLVSFANELANESENIIKQYFRTTLTVDVKNDETPVTIADKNTELKIRETKGVIKNDNPETQATFVH